MTRFGSWKSLLSGALAALALGATCAVAYNKLSAEDCCKPGAACCYEGSPCCKHHASPPGSDAAR
jgi:hypothetical protein